MPSLVPFSTNDGVGSTSVVVLHGYREVAVP